MEIRINPLLLLLLPASFIAFGVISTQFDAELQESRGRMREVWRAEINADLEQQTGIAIQETADARYLGGACREATEVIEGLLYYGVADGTPICDRTGATARIQDGVAVDVAHTDDEQVIREWLGW